MVYCNLPDEIWCLVAENVKFVDLLNLSIVSKRFYYISRSRNKFVPAMRISKYIFDFDDGCFKLLCSEMSLLGENIHKKFKEAVVKNSYVFSIIDLTLKIMVFELLPFKIYCHIFFWQRGWTTANKCNICTRFFVDDSDLGT